LCEPVPAGVAGAALGTEGGGVDPAVGWAGVGADPSCGCG
jgi:hypothetical protein